MKLYPYIPNVGAVRKHFTDIAEGKEQIGYRAKRKYTILKRVPKTPHVQLITPTAMVVEQAKSQVKQQGKTKSKSSQKLKMGRKLLKPLGKLAVKRKG